jgi:hypothetical protein
MKIERVGNKKAFVLKTEEIILLISYETPVALILREHKEAYRTKEFYSRTTTKHINEFLYDYNNYYKEVKDVEQNGLDSFLRRQTVKDATQVREGDTSCPPKNRKRKLDLED